MAFFLPIGGLYATYHLLGEPETTIENKQNPKKGKEIVFLCHPFSGAKLLLVSGRLLFLPIILVQWKMGSSKMSFLCKGVTLSTSLIVGGRVAVAKKEWTEVDVIVEWLLCLFHFFQTKRSVYVRSTPHPVTVTTRIITFLVGNPNLNLHLPLLLGGG